MKQRIIAFFSVLLLLVSPAFAVLKEKDLSQTLLVLKSELKHFTEQQVTNTRQFDELYKRQNEQMAAILDQSNKTALVLYSQQADFMFDLSYACHEATELYHEFEHNARPFSQWLERSNLELRRYESLIKSLNDLPDVMMTTEQLKADRNECILLAKAIRETMMKNRNKFRLLQQRHDIVEKRLYDLHEYAEERYASIRQSVFVNGDTDFPTILKQLSGYVRMTQSSLNEKYQPSSYTSSTWRGPIIMFLFTFVFLWLAISSFFSFILIRFLVPKRLQDKKFKERRFCMILCSSMITFGIVVTVLRLLFMQDNYFFQMASSLLMEYAWLMVVMLVSLLVRLWKHPERIKRGVKIYSPIFLLGFVVIMFRITFMPNRVVQLLFPPILILCAIWQAYVIFRHNNTAEGKVSKFDYIYAYLSLLVISMCAISSWMGFAFLSVQVLIWWFMQLTCIQSITCVYRLLHIYQSYKHEKELKKVIKNAAATGNKVSKEEFKLNIHQTWLYDFVYKALVPIFSVASIMFSIYWAAMMFDLHEMLEQVFLKRFIDYPGLISLSLFTLSLVLALFFLVRYVLYVIREFYTYAHKKKYGEKKMVGLGLNVVTILVWGVFIIMSMKILSISDEGIVIAIGGMSTGLGFAMKDTIENLFYGISLMAGRVKIGDMVELEGIRGKVINITYQSTMVETLDGSVMAFLNTQLFTKNFKNLTKNHGYEVVKIPVGVAYGTDVKLVRQLLEARMVSMDCYHKKRGIQLLFDNFGDNSVDLIMVVWVPVNTKLTAVSAIKEAIYETFNANHIEIPYPQRDIYVRQLPSMKSETVI